jgi:hypothetical protein
MTLPTVEGTKKIISGYQYDIKGKRKKRKDIMYVKISR